MPRVLEDCGRFTFTRLTKGSISVVAQSVGVGEVIIQRRHSLGEGFRMYASNGNAADVSVPEILEYWAQDEGTKVIVLHVEVPRDVVFRFAPLSRAAACPRNSSQIRNTPP